MKSIVVLGGYGNFGRRVVSALAHEPNCRVFVCGRNIEQAVQVARQEGGGAEPLSLDCHAPDFSARLRELGASLVIHTAGPFQGQGYAVPQACIDAGAHYIDLADGRDFVCGIKTLDDAARANDVLVVSGASSLPALSSAVVDSLRAEFSSIDSIDYSITSGAKPPGQATMNGVLAYAGRPFSQWRDGEWRETFGWLGLTRRRYPHPVNARWIAQCDVPDLDLFPERYAPVRTVQFRAGGGPVGGMFGVGFASWLVRIGAMRTLVAYVPRLHRVASAIARFGSKSSAMHVSVRGLDLIGKPAARTWYLIAEQDHGPFIPSFPAIALARKILRNQVAARGATPCMGLLTAQEILDVGRGLSLRVIML
ncbi:MAG: saccharopine dehydrogenase NADP-binding domain-containing protein [Steroidobacter sp.]